MTGMPSTEEERQRFGITEPKPEVAVIIRQLLRFDDIEPIEALQERAMALASLARSEEATIALINPPAFFHDILCAELQRLNITPAFPVRVIGKEQAWAHGKVYKMRTSMIIGRQ
ncbi:MAG: hypothetical protein D6746_04765 [Bacteroidetes bacterium]|nr:MAG: hypothetical protein D6746_04765 [Bacteroidota bacterium]